MVSEAESHAVPDRTALFQLHPEVLAAVAHGAPFQQLHPPAQKYRHRVAVTEGRQQLCCFKGIPAEVAEGNQGVDVQVGSELDPLKLRGSQRRKLLLQVGQVFHRHGETGGLGVPAVAGEVMAELIEGGDNIELSDAAAARMADGIRRMNDNRGVVKFFGQTAGHQSGDAHGVFSIRSYQKGWQPPGDDLLPGPE